ncbi:M12 family metallo-peptidase [Streptomyces sp. NPDC018029]|uniref:InlB B-repeat-containing protein n=1 Tax=Streptomyces sp. NPDC018029 TaxID=3365032 RepID=UPI0037B4F4CF
MSPTISTRPLRPRGAIRLVCLSAALSLTTAASADPHPSGRRPAANGTGLPRSGTDVLRERTVGLDLADHRWLCASGGFGRPAEHDLGLFPGMRITVVQEGREVDGDTVTWTGHVKGEPGRRAVIAASQVCGHADGTPPRTRPGARPAQSTGPAVDALVDLGTRAYHVTTLPGAPGERSRLRITEEDPRARRGPTPDDTAGDEASADELRDSLKDRAPADPAAPAVIDVLAGHTPAAVRRVGGEQAMAARLGMAESYMNQALADSGVAARIDLVGRYDTGYHGDQTADLMFDKLSDPADTDLGAVAHRLRERLGVDLVTVVNDVPVGSSGRAALPTRGHLDSALAFSAVDVQSLVKWYNLGHELGHNLGLFHDRTTLAEHNAPGTYRRLLNSPSGTGWITPRRDHHSLMAYAESCGAPCGPVNQYSNTQNTVDGQPLGDEHNDNASLARRTAPIVAAYRTSKVARTRHPLTLEATPNGTVRPAVHGPYAPGTTVGLTAAPAAGYRVAAWVVDGRRHDLTEEKVTLTMDRPYTVSAVFVPA